MDSCKSSRQSSLTGGDDIEDDVVVVLVTSLGMAA
jgi:hypothetical protein